MDLIPRIATTPEELAAFTAQVKNSGLPFQDLNQANQIRIGYFIEEELVGTGALEIHDQYGLLRSLSVKFGIRGQSLGSMITDHLLLLAKENQLKTVFLLTETAHGFFKKKGFIDVTREAVPDQVKASTEFAHVCPTSAVCMQLEISPT
ncbi:MAG: GNAT family N-acetyltransferase [Cyclobacteriaceae bacterium]|nr:GNAT family N-acetyltransferase [Cyclobacteriaceae bacterium]